MSEHLKQALEALRPFAEIADLYAKRRTLEIKVYADEGEKPPPDFPDSHRVSVTLGNLRRAAETYARLSKESASALEGRAVTDALQWFVDREAPLYVKFAFHGPDDFAQALQQHLKECKRILAMQPPQPTTGTE
jgi:hypothetical protein